MSPAIKVINWLCSGVVVAVLALILWRMWAEASDPVLYWQRMLREGDVDRQREAVSYLTRQGDGRAIPDLARALESPDEELRSLAVQGLSQTFARIGGARPRGGAPEVPDGIVEALKARAREDSSGNVRSNAIGALAMLAHGDPEARALFLARLEDREEYGDVRAAAFGALEPKWQLSEEGLRYSSDPDPEVRQAVLRCLLAAQRGPFQHHFGHRRYWGEVPLVPNLEIARRGLSDPEPSIRFSAMRLLPRDHRFVTGPWRGIVPDLLAVAGGDEDPAVRGEACRFLGIMTAGSDLAPGTIEALEARLTDEDLLVRSAAADAIARFGADAIPTLPALAKAEGPPQSPRQGEGRPFSQQMERIVGAWLALHPPG
jgi:HEAT repeat protein